MCEHCSTGIGWREPYSEEAGICEYSPEPEKGTEMPDMCPNHPVAWAFQRFVEDHLCDFGTRAHILIEQIIQGLEPEIPAEMEPVVQSFTSWRQDAGLDIQLTETMVYSGKYRYAGASCYPKPAG